MNVATQAAPKPVVIEPEAIRHNKLVAVHFLQSVAFAGQSFSVRIPATADSIVPAVIQLDGTPTAIDKGQRSDGLLIRKRSHDGQKNQWTVKQTFVTWANVGELVYAE